MQTQWHRFSPVKIKTVGNRFIYYQGQPLTVPV